MYIVWGQKLIFTISYVQSFKREYCFLNRIINNMIPHTSDMDNDLSLYYEITMQVT